jgi:lipid A 4'-phosphatase
MIKLAPTVTDAKILTQFVRHFHKFKLHCLQGFLLAFLLFTCLFIFAPQLDIGVSSFFYQEGAHFPANEHWFVKAIYDLTPWFGRAMLLIAMVVSLIAIFIPSKISRRHWRRACAMMAVLVFGLGLLVHAVLKDGMGRPRPRDLQIFAGTTSYVPVFTHSQFCASNCSFVSGHAAVGFSLMSLGMFSVRRRRQFWLMAGLLSGGVIGAVRIAQGGHFLSDVVFSFLAIWMSHLLVRALWLRFRSRQLYKAPNFVEHLN